MKGKVAIVQCKFVGMTTTYSTDWKGKKFAAVLKNLAKSTVIKIPHSRVFWRGINSGGFEVVNKLSN